MRYVPKNELGKWDLPDVLLKLETAQKVAAEVGINANLIKPLFDKISGVAKEAAYDVREAKRTFDQKTIEEVIVFWAERIPSPAEFDPQYNKYCGSAHLDDSVRIHVGEFWEEVKRAIKLIPDLSEDHNVSVWAKSHTDNPLARVWVNNDLDYEVEEELI